MKPVIENVLSTYGWSCIQLNNDYHIFNRKKIRAAIVKFTGDNYKIVDNSERKLMTGKGQIEKSLTTLLTTYFYCSPI